MTWTVRPQVPPGLGADLPSIAPAYSHDVGPAPSRIAEHGQHPEPPVPGNLDTTRAPGEQDPVPWKVACSSARPRQAGTPVPEGGPRPHSPCSRARRCAIASSPSGKAEDHHSVVGPRSRPPAGTGPASRPARTGRHSRCRVFRRIMPSGSLIRSRRYRKTAVSNLVPLSFFLSAYAYASQDGHPQPRQRPTMPTAPPHSGHTRSGSGGVSTPANGSKLGFVIAAPYPRVLFRRTCLSTCRSRCARGR